MRRESHIEQHIRAECESRGVDRAIAAVATRQHGVVSRAQLLALGATRGGIARRIQAGRLHPLHQGVYAVGHLNLSQEARWLAAVLAAGPGAVLSHTSAARLWDLLPATEQRIAVSAPRNRRGDATVRVHLVTLLAAEVTQRRGIAVTTPIRTLVDVAPTLAGAQLERAIRQALYDHLTTPAALSSCLSTYQGRRGMKSLRRAVERIAEAPGITRSELEQAFLHFLRKRSLPSPRLNVRMQLNGRCIEADCVWREQCVIVELDGRRAHDNAGAFEHDRARDRELTADGWKVLRITWRSLRDDADAIATQLRGVLQPLDAGGRSS